MPTRFYLPGSGAAAVSPAYDAVWDDTASASRIAAVTTKIAVAPVSPFPANQVAPSNWDWLARQYVSGPFGAQTISAAETIRAQIRGLSTGNDTYHSLVVRVVSNDGSTFRGTLLAYGLGAAMSLVSGVNRAAPAATAVSAVTMQNGDRLVFDVGARLNGAGTFQCQLYLGDNNGTDLPVDETTTAANDPWIELSKTLAPFGSNENSRMILSFRAA